MHHPDLHLRLLEQDQARRDARVERLNRWTNARNLNRNPNHEGASIMSTATKPASRILALALGLPVLLAGANFLLQSVFATPGYGSDPEATTLDVDVAEDGTRFVFDDEPVFDDGLPAYGNSFVTQGFIYQDGTLDATNGVLIDDDGNAAPEFPDKVIGEWTCYGTFIGDGAHETIDPWVVTTQIFEFDDGSSFVSVGTELPQQAGTVTRAITGGAGDYATAAGQLE